MLVCRNCLTEPYYLVGECLECQNCNWFANGDTEQEAIDNAVEQGHLRAKWQKMTPRNNQLPEGLCF